MRFVRPCLAAAALLLLFTPCDSLVPTSTANVTWLSLSPGESESAAAAKPISPGVLAADEMLGSTQGRPEQWSDQPELVVLTSVMQYRPGGLAEYVATADAMTDADVEVLIADLTDALRLLTGNTFDRFAAIRREAIAPGATTRVIRPHQIVVGRYQDVRKKAGVLGLGGRSVRRDGVITGAAVILDDEYDRAGAMRALLRTHELGHALGYKHVESRESIMNPRIGPAATDLDRQIALIAYQKAGQTH